MVHKWTDFLNTQAPQRVNGGKQFVGSPIYKGAAQEMTEADGGRLNICA